MLLMREKAPHDFITMLRTLIVGGYSLQIFFFKQVTSLKKIAYEQIYVICSLYSLISIFTGCNIKVTARIVSGYVFYGVDVDTYGFLHHAPIF